MFGIVRPDFRNHLRFRQRPGRGANGRSRPWPDAATARKVWREQIRRGGENDRIRQTETLQLCAKDVRAEKFRKARSARRERRRG